MTKDDTFQKNKQFDIKEKKLKNTICFKIRSKFNFDYRIIIFAFIKC